MSKYFTLKELTRSSKAQHLGIDNTPNEEQIKTLQAFIENVLDPLREAFGKPIVVNSGFRSKELNEAVGGVPTSHHTCQNGYAAADLNTRTKQGNKRIFELAQELNLPHCELFNEHNYTWIHISYNINKVEKEIGNIG